MEKGQEGFGKNMNKGNQNGNRDQNNKNNRNGNEKSRKNQNNRNDHNKNDDRKGPRTGCFVCGGNHFATKCPQQYDRKEIPSKHHIHVAVDHPQVDLQATPIQLTSTLFGITISILVDTSATECFIDPKVVARLTIRAGFMAKPWSVEYGKRQVEQCLFCSELELPNF